MPLSSFLKLAPLVGLVHGHDHPLKHTHPLKAGDYKPDYALAKWSHDLQAWSLKESAESFIPDVGEILAELASKAEGAEGGDCKQCILGTGRMVMGHVFKMVDEKCAKVDLDDDPKPVDSSPSTTPKSLDSSPDSASSSSPDDRLSAADTVAVATWMKDDDSGNSKDVDDDDKKCPSCKREKMFCKFWKKDREVAEGFLVAMVKPMMDGYFYCMGHGECKKSDSRILESPELAMFESGLLKEMGDFDAMQSVVSKLYPEEEEEWEKKMWEKKEKWIQKKMEKSAQEWDEIDEEHPHDFFARVAHFIEEHFSWGPAPEKEHKGEGKGHKGEGKGHKGKGKGEEVEEELEEDDEGRLLMQLDFGDEKPADEKPADDDDKKGKGKGKGDNDKGKGKGKGDDDDKKGKGKGKGDKKGKGKGKGHQMAFGHGHVCVRCYKKVFGIVMKIAVHMTKKICMKTTCPVMKAWCGWAKEHKKIAYGIIMGKVEPWKYAIGKCYHDGKGKGKGKGPGHHWWRKHHHHHEDGKGKGGKGSDSVPLPPPTIPNLRGSQDMQEDYTSNGDLQVATYL